jgi:hypothetical protein
LVYKVKLWHTEALKTADFLKVRIAAGVQADLRAYLDRPAVFGRDDRSGSFALWLALEIMQLPALDA